MTIREANIQIKQIDNDIELYEDKADAKKLNELFDKKERLENWIIKELKIIGEFEPLKAKIIKLREEKHLKWELIAEATHYSKRQCINIYKAYIDKRAL